MTNTLSYEAKETPANVTLTVITSILIGTGSVYGMDRADSWRAHLQARMPLHFDVDGPVSSGEETQRPDLRSPAEHLANIRNVLNPAVADLAVLFDVSRQAIYKWLAGSSIPEGDKHQRIADLSKIADAFLAADVSRAGTLLKMKTFAGRSLLDLLKNGENTEDHVISLIREAKAMEASYKQSGLENSRAKPTSDWQSSLSIPGSAERT